MEKIILIGFGGHAKSVADTIERQNFYEIIGYTELSSVKSKYTYLGTDDVLVEYFNKGVKNVFICQGYLGKGILREKLYSMVKKIGFNLPVIIDPSSIIAKSCKIGEGTFVGKGVIINSEAIIDKMCIINTKAVIEHECIVREFSHIAVGATLCGQVHIGKSVFVGANATIIQTRSVNDYTIVPAGSTVR